MLRNGLRMADNIIKEGNNEVKALCLKNVLNHDVITQASLRVSTGVVRREKFSFGNQIKKIRSKYVCKLRQN